MERCLVDEELALLADDVPAPELAAHAERCTACAARLADERRDAALFRELRGVARARARPEIKGYRLEHELSRGGQGVVWRAVQEATGRPVALKLLAEDATGSARVRRRFVREVELAARLAHPGIVTVFDSGVAEGTLWYAMELVEGERLDAHVARTRPSPARRLALFLELCEAVAHAHRSGVMHRDLKPANVLVERDGRVRVLDFGTALPVDPAALARARVTAPGEFLGTLAYAAPEQVAAEGGGDTRTDVYALGVVLHELLVERPPLSLAGGLREVVERITSEVPARLVELGPDLAAIVACALEKEPERRYPSVEALARDVRLYRAHQPIEARARRTGHVLALFARRHRRALVLAALVLAVTGGLSAAWMRARFETSRAREQADLVRAVFEDVLAAAAPQRMGGDAPLRDVLALAAREIEQGLEGAPDVQAAVQLTIGETYGELLRFEEAEPHLRAAVARFRALSDAELELASALDALGRVLTARASAEAVAVQEEALALRRAGLAPDDALVAASERGLAAAGLARLRESDGARVRALLDAALARFERSLGPEHVEVAETRLVRARLTRSLGQDQAEDLSAALAIFERPENARDPRRIGALGEHASWLARQQRFDEAGQELARAENLTFALFGDEQAVETLRRQADLFYARAEHVQAEELTRRALVRELRGWKESRADVADEIESVAAALEHAKPPEAAPPYVAAFRLLRRFEGDGAFELAGWMNGIAVVLLPQERLAEAEALLTEALEIRCRSWGAECPLRQRTCVLLAEVARHEERVDEAARWLGEAIAIAERRGEPESAEHARALLAECCAARAERP